MNMDHSVYAKLFRYGTKQQKKVNTYKVIYTDIHHDKDG